MSLQRVARVGVRQLRLADGLGRPGRVVGIESQLRQLTLSTQPRQLIQPVGASSSILSQHSRLFSTQGACLSDSTSKTPARPRRKTKSNKQRKPKARAPTKKVLTEKQKENKAKQQQREHIKALKETALQPPKKLSVKPNNLAFMELHPANKQTTSSVTEAFVKTVNQVKELPRHEYEKFQAQAEANSGANELAYDAWVKTFTPSQIKEANQARRNLGRLLNKRMLPLKDDRLVTRPRTSYILFSNGRRESGDFMHLELADTSSRIAEEWKNMTAQEKEPYVKSAAQDLERYYREHLEVYGEPAMSVSRSKSKSNSPP